MHEVDLNWLTGASDWPVAADCLKSEPYALTLLDVLLQSLRKDGGQIILLTLLNRLF